MKKISIDEIFHTNYGWLDTRHHFSFGPYYDSKKMSFGDIRVINDDIIKGQTGFDTHPHSNMEILTYIISGELTHGDSLKNQKTIGPGYIQYMSAGRGIYHSEHNNSSQDLRLLQIWILPDKEGYEPSYGDYEYGVKNRKGHFIHLVSGKDSNGPVKINQDFNLFVGEFEEDTKFVLPPDKKLYGIVIDGKAIVNNIEVGTREAFIVEEGSIDFHIDKYAHIILFETK